MNEQLRKELIRDESLRLKAYKDSLGYWTIGIGHLLGKGDEPRIKEITFEEAQAFYEYDVKKAEATALRILGAFDVDSVRGRAFINMAFNLGSKLALFRNFVAAVKAGNWEWAGREMKDSEWWDQVGERAVRLRQMVETNQWDMEGT